MSTKRRIIQGIGANGVGHAVTILVQLASVPILMHAWGIELYGEWVTVSAIPSYLALSDIGLSLVAGNSLALMAEKGDPAEMQVIYQSTWVMVTALSMSVLLLAMCLVWFTSPAPLLGLTRISGRTLDWTLLFLFFYMAFSMQSGILQLPFKVLKRNPMAVAVVNLIRLGEWVAAVAVVLAGGGVVLVAMTFMLARAAGNLSFGVLVSRSQSSLRIGVRHARLGTIRSLLRPSLAAMCFPFGLSLTVQGFVLLVGGMIGSIGVAVFSIYRTFTRVPIQLATAINRAVWPELSYAVGAAQITKARRLVIKMLLSGIILSIASFATVRLFGADAIDLWVGKTLAHNPPLLLGLALAASVHILWQPYWVALMATNMHTRFALAFLVISAISLVFGWIFLRGVGLPGAGYAILMGEMLLSVAAYYSYHRNSKALEHA